MLDNNERVIELANVGNQLREPLIQARADRIERMQRLLFYKENIDREYAL